MTRLLNDFASMLCHYRVAVGWIHRRNLFLLADPASALSANWSTAGIPQTIFSAYLLSSVFLWTYKRALVWISVTVYSDITKPSQNTCSAWNLWCRLMLYLDLSKYFRTSSKQNHLKNIFVFGRAAPRGKCGREKSDEKYWLQRVLTSKLFKCQQMTFS